MSQLVACRNGNGVVLGADSKAIHFSPAGAHNEVNVERLVQLGERSAILAGGAAESVMMCQSLQRFVREEGLVDADEIYRAALPFLSSEYERFMRKTCEVVPLDPIHHVYFILGGIVDGNGEDPFRLYFLWARKKLPRLDGEEIATAYSVPRRIKLELKLNELCKSNAALAETLTVVREGLERVGEVEELGRPFRFASIGQDGVTMHA